MRIAIVDNYDSFTHNLAQGLRIAGARVEIVRNDEVSVSDLEREKFDGIVLSPGPCTPDDAGITLDVVRTLAGKVPLLGICLGHQAIAQAFGARIVRADLPKHGRASDIDHDGTGSLRGVPSPFSAGRYHSLVIDPATLAQTFRVSATSRDDGAIMAIVDEARCVEGLQFHPESIMTPVGNSILGTWLACVEARA